VTATIGFTQLVLLMSFQCSRAFGERVNAIFLTGMASLATQADEQHSE